MWYLYVLRCRGNTFYAGITTDVARRLREHQAGTGARYTRAHLPVTLAAAWRFPDQSTALRAEAKFKSLPRYAKTAWVENCWPFENAPCDFSALHDSAVRHFCPHCGGRLATQTLEGHPVAVCTICGWIDFRNPKPCAGVLLLRQGRVLLARRARAPRKDYWDLPGGFLNDGEAPAACAVREAREELGLEVTLRTFLGFYMDEYTYQDETYSILNIYYLVDATGEPQAGDDAAEVGWFPLADPPELAFPHERRVLQDLHQRVTAEATL